MITIHQLSVVHPVVSRHPSRRICHLSQVDRDMWTLTPSLASDDASGCNANSAVRFLRAGLQIYNGKHIRQTWWNGKNQLGGMCCYSLHVSQPHCDMQERKGALELDEADDIVQPPSFLFTIGFIRLWHLLSAFSIASERPILPRTSFYLCVYRNHRRRWQSLTALSWALAMLCLPFF